MDNAVCGTIRALLFIGDHYEATVELDAGQSVTAHLPATGGWCEGQRVSLALSADELRVWEYANA